MNVIQAVVLVNNFHLYLFVTLFMPLLCPTLSDIYIYIWIFVVLVIKKALFFLKKMLMEKIPSVAFPCLKTL